jgi:predicted Zn-dependent protease
MLTFQARALLKPVLDNLNKRNGVVDKIITQLGGAVAMLARLEFSRQDEQQADLLSLYNMLRAGWDPRGLVKILTALEGLESGQSDAVMHASPVLSGHPPAAERLAVVQRELTVVSIPEDARTDSFDFRACKAAMQLLPPPAKAAQE